jgi:hypothetical protein
MRGMPAAAAIAADSADPAPLESSRHLPGEPQAAAIVAAPEWPDEEQSMHSPMDEPPPPADADDEVPQR